MTFCRFSTAGLLIAIQDQKNVTDGRFVLDARVGDQRMIYQFGQTRGGFDG